MCGSTAQQCKLGLFQDSDFAGDLEDSKSTSCGVLCIFGSHTFVPISWMCKKQLSVSHSSTEAEIISLDADGRYSRSYSLGFGDWFFHFAPSKIKQPTVKLRRDPLQATEPNMHNTIQCKHTNVVPPNIDHISSNTIVVLVPYCMSLKTMEPWLWWLSKAEVRQWDMFQGPTELLWTPKIQIRDIDYKHKS